MNAALPLEPRLQQLQAAGAARLDPVGWHYIEVLARRTQAHTGAARPLLQDKLERALDACSARLQAIEAAPFGAHEPPPSAAPRSALAQLLQDIAPAASAVPLAAATPAAVQKAGWQAERPHVQQFRQQLSKISVQKQVRQAIAQAPQNAGPINSHMLVLRALGLMRDISPDYLDRFMGYVDTLLCLDEAERNRSQPKKSAPAKRAKRQA